MKTVITVTFFLGSLMLLQGCATPKDGVDRCESSRPVYSENQKDTYCAARPHFENFRI